MNDHVGAVPVGGTFAVQDAADWTPPGGELSLDDLFPNPELTPQAPSAPATPAAPAAPEYFLKASTGTVYKTFEDTVRGTEEKDRTIERLKQDLAKSQTQPSQVTATTTSADVKKQMFGRLRSAAEKGDESAYIDALAEIQMATLSQFAPALVGAVEDQAIRQVESESKDFRTWLNGPEYQKTMERFPSLANAIQTAKSDPRVTHQLGEFYTLAHRAYVAEHTNEIAAAAARTSATPAPIPTRPTLSPSTPTPVPNGIPVRSAQLTREQILNDRAARADFLKRYREERGPALDARFSDIGL